MTSDLIYAFLGQVFDHIEKKDNVGISDIISYVSTRPFNMKGQEFQELIVYPLKKAINGNEMAAQLGIRIESTSDKQKTDLYLNTNNEKYNFSIKNYQTTRFQVSTMVNELTKYEGWFSSHTHDSKMIIDDEKKSEIINDIKKDLSDDITIFALTKIKGGEKIDIYFLSLNEKFLDNIEYMEAEYADRIKTPHWRIRFYFPGIKEHLFTLDLGKNALNRGLRGENWNGYMENAVMRKEFFYDLLAVTEKDLTPFWEISQDLKNEALMKIIEESIKIG